MAAVRERLGEDDVRRVFTARDWPRVDAFLAHHTFLMPLLAEARPRLAHVFGAETPISLDVTTDPDEGDTALFVRIQTTHPPSDALDRLDRFYTDWWLAHLPTARGAMHVDVE